VSVSVLIGNRFKAVVPRLINVCWNCWN